MSRRFTIAKNMRRPGATLYDNGLPIGQFENLRKAAAEAARLEAKKKADIAAGLPLFDAVGPR